MRCDKVTNFFRFNKLFAKSCKNQLPPPQHEIAAVFLSYPDRPGICLPEAQPKDLLRIQPHPPERHIALQQIRPVSIYLKALKHQLVLAALLNPVTNSRRIRGLPVLLLEVMIQLKEIKSRSGAAYARITVLMLLVDIFLL